MPEAVHLVRTLQTADEQLNKTLDQQELKLLPTSTVTAVPDLVPTSSRHRRLVRKGMFKARAGVKGDNEGDSNVPKSGDGNGTGVRSDENDGSGSAEDCIGDDNSDDDVADSNGEDEDGYDENEFDFTKSGSKHMEVNEKFKKDVSLESLVYGVKNWSIADTNDGKQWISEGLESQRRNEADVVTTTKLFENESDDESTDANNETQLLGDVSMQKFGRKIENYDETSLLSDGFLYAGLGLTARSLKAVEQFWSVKVLKRFRVS